MVIGEKAQFSITAPLKTLGNICYWMAASAQKQGKNSAVVYCVLLVINNVILKDFCLTSLDVSQPFVFYLSFTLLFYQSPVGGTIAFHSFNPGAPNCCAFIVKADWCVGIIMVHSLYCAVAEAFCDADLPLGVGVGVFQQRALNQTLRVNAEWNAWIWSRVKDCIWSWK